jgi:hypothetical protein
MDAKIIRVRLAGLRPLMFDRYAGDNTTKLPTAEKLYLGQGQCLIMPAINLFSLLCAENTKSVCRQFFGKQGETIGLGIASFVNIDPFEIPILDDKGPIIFTAFNKQISVHKSVARVKGGIPNPKERPLIALPWAIEFRLEYMTNTQCSYENLRQAVTMGGILGLGTFRPFFGRYEVVQWAE